MGILKADIGRSAPALEVKGARASVAADAALVGCSWSHRGVSIQNGEPCISQGYSNVCFCNGVGYFVRGGGATMYPLYYQLIV